MTTAPRRRPPELLLYVSIAREEQAVPRARRAVVNALHQRRLADLADNAGLVTSELVTNAVLHGDGDSASVVLEYACGEQVTISVSDEAPGELPSLCQPSPGAENGRGMLLVGRLAKEWGVTVNPGSGTKWTWARLAAGDECP